MKHDKSCDWNRPATTALDLKGRRIAIVGGNGGIGRGFAHLPAARGARVVVVGQTFRDAGTPNTEFIPANLQSTR